MLVLKKLQNSYIKSLIPIMSDAFNEDSKMHLNENGGLMDIIMEILLARHFCKKDQEVKNG